MESNTQSIIPPVENNVSSQPIEGPSENLVSPQTKQNVRLVDIPINSECDALNMMVNFLSLAQKRGAFTIDESAKIWESINKFQRD